MRVLARWTAVVAALTLIAPASVAVAHADGKELSDPRCETVTTDLEDRLLWVGGSEYWAEAQFTREVEICEVAEDDNPQAKEPWSVYRAEAVDSGSFVTLARSDTPNGSGKPLPGGITGTLSGGFTDEFVAPPDFSNFDPAAIDDTVTGDSLPRHSAWLRTLFSDPAGFRPGSHQYRWEYESCGETFVFKNGQNEGDITSFCNDQHECRTITTDLQDYSQWGHLPDGPWATAQMTRVATICELGEHRDSTADTPLAVYRGTAVDTGSFVTVDSNDTPGQSGQPLPADIPGSVVGDFSYEFMAASSFATFDASEFDGETITGTPDDPPIANDWFVDMFVDDDNAKRISAIRSVWVYGTCGETYVFKKGQGEDSGDITRFCEIVPDEPSVTDETCDDPGTLTIPDQEMVRYTVDGDVTDAGTHEVDPGTYEVVAESDNAGYVLGGAQRWTVTVEASDESCTSSTPSSTPTEGSPSPAPSEGDESTPPATPGPTSTGGGELPDTGSSLGWMIPAVALVALGGLAMGVRRIQA